MVACRAVVSHVPLSAPPAAALAWPRPRLHLEPVGGLAGDMFLAACLDLGVPLSVVRGAIEALGLREVEVEAWRSSRGGRAGTRFRVCVDGESLEGDDPEGLIAAADWDLVGLLGLLRAADLAEPVRARAARMFRRLSIAWSRSARVPITAIRFAGGPGIDFLVDLVGAAAVVEHLAARAATEAGERERPGELRITCGPVFLGGPVPDGLPVPPPVVGRLLDDIPHRPPPEWWRRRDGAGQCLTPTGATLLAELVDEWVKAPPDPEGEGGAVAEGWGLGAKELEDRPNGLRVLWMP